MNIDELLFNLHNPSVDQFENHNTMMHAANLIKLMQDRIHYLSDSNVELRDKVERLAMDLGLKDQGYVK